MIIKKLIKKKELFIYRRPSIDFLYQFLYHPPSSKNFLTIGHGCRRVGPSTRFTANHPRFAYLRVRIFPMTVYAAKHGKGQHNTAMAIQNRTPFNAGNLTGYPVPHQYGVLPAVWRDDLSETMDRVDYVVYSYNTPIAWHVDGEGWVYPRHYYTSSTAGHQSLVRTALFGGPLRCEGDGWQYATVEPQGEIRTGTLAASRRAVEVFA